MNRSWRLLAVVLALSGALLACSLSLNNGDAPANNTSGSGGGGSSSATTPTVHILDPTSGVIVPANQRVDITVETDTEADRFQLNVGGRVAGTKSLPPDQSGPTKAILSWVPDREGTFSLEVVAFNGSAVSAPAALLLQVSGTAGSTSSTTAGCTGRVLVSQLNFRDGPGTAMTQLGQFDVGETVTIVGRNADSSWYKAQRFNAQQVWVINNTQWIQIEGQCSALPVVG